MYIQFSHTSVLLIFAVMQHVHHYTLYWAHGMCIDLQYLSVGLCSRMQSSGPAQDSRREPSVSKFSSRWWNTAAAAIINGPIYVTAWLAIPLSPAHSRREIAFPSPVVPPWLNRPNFPAGFFLRAGHGLLLASTSLLLSSGACPHAGILGSRPQLNTHGYIKLFCF